MSPPRHNCVRINLLRRIWVARRSQIKADTHTYLVSAPRVCCQIINILLVYCLFFFSFAGGEHQTTTTRKGKMLISVLLYMMMMLMIEKKINMTWHTHHIMTKELDDELIMIIFSPYLVLPPTIIYNKRKIVHITLDLMNVTPLLFGIIQTQCKLLYRNVKKINIWTTCCQKFSLSHMFLHDIEYTCLVQVKKLKGFAKYVQWFYVCISFVFVYVSTI